MSFIQKILGFTCGAKNEDWGWAAMHRDQIEIMIAVPNAHIPFDKPLFTGSFYILTENVDELWEQLKNTTKIVYPIDNFEWGMREFAIHDNNSYMLQFGQDIEELTRA